jgi:probable HAF family extracellular repeat protein
MGAFALATGLPAANAASAAPTAVDAPAVRYRLVDLAAGTEWDSRTIGFGPRGLIAGWVTEDVGNRAATWRVPGTEPAQVVGPEASAPYLVGPRGELVGIVVSPGEVRVERWWRGRSTLLSDGMVASPAPIAIDSRGRVLIVSHHGESGTHARITDGRRVREVTGLPASLPPEGDRPGYAPSLADMNDRGEVVGTFRRPGADETAFVWRDGEVTWLPALPDAGPGGTASTRFVDDRGVVAGVSSADGGTATNPVLWRDGEVIDLGRPPGGPWCQVQGHSGSLTSGYIVGSCGGAAPGELRSWVWHDGAFTDLGDLGVPWVTAQAVNERGQVVGTADVAPEGQHAMVWDRGVMTDLGTLGGTVSSTTDIDEHGRITGVAGLPDGRNHAVLWMPERTG